MGKYETKSFDEMGAIATRLLANGHEPESLGDMTIIVHELSDEDLKALIERDPTPEEIAAEAEARLDAIKSECRRRIYAVASQEAQINVSTIAGVISGKAASARSDQEKAILAGAAAGIQWVADMRGAIAPLAADTEADYLSDDAWPSCPPEAVAVYGQF